MYSPMQSLNAFAAGGQIGSGIRNRKTQNAFSKLAGNQDWQGAQSLAFDRGNMQLAQYAGDQLTAQKEQQTAADLQKMEQFYVGLTELTRTAPEQRMGLSQQLSETLGIPAPTSPDELTDDALNQGLSVLRAQLMKAGPEGAEGFTLSQGQTRFDAQGNQIANNPKVEAPKAPTFKTVTTDEGIFQYDPANPAGTMQFLGNAPERAPVAEINLPANRGETEFQKQRGTSASNRMDSITEAGDAAGATLADAEMMNTLIDQIDYTGFGSETLLNVQKLGRMVGLDIGDDVPAKEAATRLTAKLGLALKSDLPGPMSDGDRDFLLSIPPNIGTTRAGNKALVFMMMKRAQFAQNMQQSLIQADPKTMQEFYDWERQFRSTYPPLFDDASKRDLLAALSEAGS